MVHHHETMARVLLEAAATWASRLSLPWFLAGAGLGAPAAIGTVATGDGKLLSLVSECAFVTGRGPSTTICYLCVGCVSAVKKIVRRKQFVCCLFWRLLVVLSTKVDTVVVNTVVGCRPRGSHRDR